MLDFCYYSIKFNNQHTDSRRDGRENQMKTIACKSGEDIFSAVDRSMGSGHFVDSFDRASTAPKPENVKRYGNPVAKVNVRPGESFYVYKK